MFQEVLIIKSNVLGSVNEGRAKLQEVLFMKNKVPGSVDYRAKFRSVN